jgi:hypothetical protein
VEYYGGAPRERNGETREADRGAYLEPMAPAGAVVVLEEMSRRRGEERT